MPDILVRDVPSEVADALTERARAAGMDRQEWLRQHFAQLVQLPIIKVSYTLLSFRYTQTSTRDSYITLKPKATSERDLS